MSIYGFRHRVACYVTTITRRGRELVVFEHADDDPDDPSGVQVPAGGMLPYESLVDAAMREVAEETGLTDLEYVDQVGFIELGLHDQGGPSMTNFVHLVSPSQAERSWQHTVNGDGEDGGLTFLCRWELLPLSFDLAGDQGAFLDQIRS